MVPLWNVGALSLPSAEAVRSPFFSVSLRLRTPFSYRSHSEGDGGLGASGVPCGPDLGECGGGGAGAATPGAHSGVKGSRWAIGCPRMCRSPVAPKGPDASSL